MAFALVMEDDLAEELCKFRANETHDVDLVEQIFRYYKKRPLFKKSYCLRYYNDKATQTSIFSGLNIRFDDLEAMAQHNTTFKVILSRDKSKFPYICISNDKMENNLSATFRANEPRDKAIEHLRALMSGVKFVFIYDRYLTTNRVWAQFMRVCKAKIFPDKINIQYPKEQDKIHMEKQNFTLKDKTPELKKLGFGWTAVDKKYKNLHDRYLVIDDKIEVILTSGIDNLMRKDRDFTYIVRDL